MEAGYDTLINSFPARSKERDAEYLDSIKYLQRKDENKKRYRNTINRREKIHGIQSNQENERYISCDSLVRQTDTLLDRHGLFTLIRSETRDKI